MCSMNRVVKPEPSAAWRTSRGRRFAGHREATVTARRREVEIRSPHAGGSGVRLTVTRKGIEVFGWYDGGVGVDDILVVPWDEVEKARRQVRDIGM